MATPVTSSLAALLMANDEELTPKDVEEIIIDTADDIGGRSPGNRINVCRAINELDGFSCGATGQ